MTKTEVPTWNLTKVAIDVVLIIGLILCTVCVDNLWTPFQRGFFCGDQTLMFPYQEDTVTALMLRIFGIGLPALSIFTCEYALLRKEKNDQRVFRVRIPVWVRGVYCVGLTFALGALFCDLSTEIAKNTIGRPRPHFFDLCKPSVNCSLPEWQNRYIQAEDYMCEGERTDLFTNMRKSFLSGHASWSSFTMIFMVLYLQKRMTWSGTRLLRHIIQFFVLMLSWYCSLSRVSDFKHHWGDVLAGYVLGTTIAVLTWQFCTDLVTKNKHSPLPQPQVDLNGNQLAS